MTLIRGERSWRRLVYSERIRVSPHTKRLLCSLRAYPRQPIGDVLAGFVL